MNAQPRLGGLDLRLDLRYALRGLVRDRAPVQLAVVGWIGDWGSEAAGAGRASELIGTIDRVGVAEGVKIEIGDVLVVIGQEGTG